MNGHLLMNFDEMGEVLDLTIFEHVGQRGLGLICALCCEVPSL